MAKSKIETKEETKIETKEVVKEMTQKQKELYQEIKSSDKGWETIKESDLTDFSLDEEPYPLPEEAKVKVYMKKFIFRWIEDSASRLQEVSRVEPPMKWWICNSTNTPFLNKVINPNTGAVHCKDQILVFKPYWMAEKVRELREGRSEAKLNAGALKNRDEEQTTWRTGSDQKIGARDTVTAVYNEEETNE